MKNEGDVKKEVKRVLSGLGIWHYMPVPSGYGTQGLPDFVCCADGHFLGIETKFGYNKLSPWQERQQRGIEAANGLYLLVNEKNVLLLAGYLINMKHVLAAVRYVQEELGGDYDVSTEFAHAEFETIIVIWSPRALRRVAEIRVPTEGDAYEIVKNALLRARAVWALEQ